LKDHWNCNNYKSLIDVINKLKESNQNSRGTNNYWIGKRVEGALDMKTIPSFDIELGSELITGSYRIPFPNSNVHSTVLNSASVCELIC